MKVAKFEIGQSFVNNSGDKATIISFIQGSKNKSRRATIQFEDGTTVEVSTPKLNKGVFKNPNKPFVCGVGYIGVGKYYASKDRIPTKSYALWRSMLDRCYSGRCDPYQDVEVCKEWLNYQNFADWYSNNSFDKGRTYQLDKDLLGDSKLYSPDTCCLLRYNINQLINLSGCGYVCKDNSWIVNSLNKNVTVSSEIIAKDVVLSYRINKLYGIIRCVERQTVVDTRIIPALWVKVFKLQEEQVELRKQIRGLCL